MNERSTDMNERTFLALRPFLMVVTFFLTCMACIYVDYHVIPAVKMWINGPGITAAELNEGLSRMWSEFPADSLKVSL